MALNKLQIVCFTPNMHHAVTISRDDSVSQILNQVQNDVNLIPYKNPGLLRTCY